VWRRIDLDVQGSPQGDPHCRAVWGGSLPIVHKYSPVGSNVRNLIFHEK
jgi:hypothetical protein